MWWIRGFKAAIETRKDRGAVAEKLACRHLKRKGHHILETNYTTKVGEIDIISRFHDMVVFTEVRSRKNDGILPEETINNVKQSHVRRTAEYYLMHCEQMPVCRFDAIAIVFDEQDRPTITHYEDAF